MRSRMPEMRHMRRLLIVKLSAIGDVVHALPVASALHRAFPHLEIDWVVGERAAPIVRCHPAVNRVIALSGSLRFSLDTLAQLRHLRSELIARRYQIALDLQGLTKSALIAALSGAPLRLGCDWLRELAPLFVKRVPRRPSSVHIVDQLLDVAHSLGAPDEPPLFELQIPEESRGDAMGLLRRAEVDGPFAVINPSAGAGGNKGWRPEGYGAVANTLAREMGLHVVLVGAPSDRDVAERTKAASNARLADLTGQTDLLQLAALLGMAEIHICGDTGSAHLAAALNVPVVSIFGRSNPDRLAPYGQQDFVVHRRDQCAPRCAAFHARAPVNSRQKCLSPPPACLDAVQPEDVLAAVRRVLHARGLSR